MKDVSVRVLWYQGKSPISKLVRFVTRSRFSHVAIGVNGSVYEAVARGIVKHEGWDAYAKRLGAVHEYEIRIPEIQADDIRWWLEYQVHRGYSILGFIAAGIFSLTGWAPVLALPGEYICSGLVAEALRMAGVRLEGEPRLYTPESLYQALVVDADDPDLAIAA